ncbi:porin [Rosenbergiella australiborealis]|uniref:Porin n=1 Tax=Rosenbergiella australiborealis TaxID=1544696 RepID=A0ABS5TAQ6_9GAMM|nr:porin [Rosenbergiella australiborealis]MBT0728507.1 porin [Rosenbergiella australiborealis]
MKTRLFSPSILALCLMGLPAVSQAEITLLKQDPQATDPLSRLNVKVGGSIRPQFNHITGVNDKSFRRNGFDGGTRFRFSVDYALTQDINWINYYELGVNIPKVFNWDHHYATGANNTTRRQWFTGFKSQQYGQLTFGQQNSVYYDVVGAKTDTWDDDMLAQAPGNGVNGDYDGSYRSRKMLKYKGTVGNADIYASYLFSDHPIFTSEKMFYKRKGAGSVGVDYHLTKDLSWGTAWNYTKAQVSNHNGQSKNYNQNIMGTSLGWTPGNWTVSAGAGFYQNFLKTKLRNTDHYFAGDAWGVEYFAGYKFPVKQMGIKAIMPYAMGDRLEYVNGRNYQRIDNGVGVAIFANYGFRVDYEHVFTSTTDKQGDLNLVRLRYDF